jgi:hypothetical protein
VLRRRKTAGFREFARFIAGHRACGTLSIHAPECNSATGFQISVICECGGGLTRWITVRAALQDTIDSPWPATSN